MKEVLKSIRKKIVKLNKLLIELNMLGENEHIEYFKSKLWGYIEEYLSIKKELKDQKIDFTIH